MIKNRKLIWPDKKIVVVTSRLLIGKLVITSGIDVDVYNVLDKKIYNAALYPNVKANNIKNRITVSPDPSMRDVCPENVKVFKKDGTEISLDFVMKNDDLTVTYDYSEGTVVTIFKDEKLAALKETDINLFAKFNKIFLWFNFPLELVYYDRKFTKLAGFTQRAWSEGDEFARSEHFTGVGKGRDGSTLILQSRKLTLCYKAACRVCSLKNLIGVAIPDYRLKNFAGEPYIAYNKHYPLQILHTENFWFSKVFINTSAMEETSKNYNMNYEPDRFGFCNEAFYHFVFYILTLGDTPVEKNTKKFKYSCEDYEYINRKEWIPENVWNLLEQAFTGKRDFSVDELLCELKKAIDYLDKNLREDKTYGMLQGIEHPNFIVPASLNYDDDENTLPAAVSDEEQQDSSELYAEKSLGEKVVGKMKDMLFAVMHLFVTGEPPYYYNNYYDETDEIYDVDGIIYEPSEGDAPAESDEPEQ